MSSKISHTQVYFSKEFHHGREVAIKRSSSNPRFYYKSSNTSIDRLIKQLALADYTVKAFYDGFGFFRP